MASAAARKFASELNGKDTKMGDIKKRGGEIGKNHELAMELWSMGGYHARLLSCLIFDKALLTPDVIERLAADMLDHDEKERSQLADWLLANQLMKARKTVALISGWEDSPSPILRRLFWYHQARLRWTHYLDGGAGPPPLLLHGHPSRAIEWAPLLPPFLESHRVLALDFLGYGESDAPDIDYAVPTQAKMVEGFLDTLGIAHVDLLGFSMGGWVALTVARDEPQRIDRLVLVGSGGLRFPTTLTPDSWVPQSLEQFREIEREQGSPAAPAFLVRDLIRTTSRRAWALRRAGTQMLSFRDALDGQLGTIVTPTLLVWGRSERIIPYATGERMQRELPDARLVGVPGCGHLVLWECTEAALPPILEFLGRSG